VIPGVLAPSPEETETPLLVMDGGIPGFPDARHFLLVPWGGEGSPFCLLRCVDTPEGQPDFVVVPPTVFFPDYACDLDDGTVERLGLLTAADVIVVVIITLGDRPDDATANLLGPVVINRRTRRAAQVVLAGSGYQVREPLRRHPA